MERCATRVNGRDGNIGITDQFDDAFPLALIVFYNQHALDLFAYFFLLACGKSP
jgi:hypothetical protein